MTLLKGLVAGVVLVSSFSALADLPLYPTGPAEDAAFIRFVNAAPVALQVAAQAEQPPLQLDPAKPASLFYAVQAGSPVNGTLTTGKTKASLAVKVEPGEFATVVAIPDGDALKTVVVHDIPDDFNGLKASLGFFNLDASCADATLRPAGRNGDLFKGVTEGNQQRRSINPVKLSVQLVCGGANRGEPLDLGDLKAGERYSVLLLPSATGPRLVATTDTVAQ